MAVREPQRVNDRLRATARRPPVSEPLELGCQSLSQGWRALTNVPRGVRLTVQDVPVVHLRRASYLVVRVGGSRRKLVGRRLRTLSSRALVNNKIVLLAHDDDARRLLQRAPHRRP
jgi:hypothetical protein